MDIPIVVFFGRPGAGKTTLVIAALENWKDGSFRGLDLDACVPQWMKDNFQRGVYPTLAQREEFAIQCCDYVKQELVKTKKPLIISFSFVNKDLRDIFRQHFPHAIWVLINTPELEAMKRIQQRKNHFYKGDNPTSVTGVEEKKSRAKDTTDRTDETGANPEWQFAPVEFDHLALDGNESIGVNAERIRNILLDRTKC
jgi:gluconate kinase